MSDSTLLIVILIVVSTLSACIIAQSIANFFAVRALARAQALQTDLAHKLCKESMDRVLAATDLAAYFKIRDSEEPRKPKKLHPASWREI